MDFLKANQVNPGSLQVIDFDLVVTVSGKEHRCCYLLENYQINSKNKIALEYSRNHIDLLKSGRSQNFKKQGFQILEVNSGNGQPLIEQVSSLVSRKNKLNILIDYSCMTKSWYAGLINYLSSLEGFRGEVNVYFSYTPSIYSKPKKAKPVKSCESLLPRSSTQKLEKPTVLIIGLGVQSGMAEYLIKKYRPDSTFVLYSDPAPKGYVETVFSNNRSIIDGLDIRTLLNYPLTDIEETSNILTNLCLDLRLKNNIIIAPVGPKVFTLVSLLLAIRFPDIDVIRVSSDFYRDDLKKKAASEPIVFKTSFIDSHE